MIQLSLLRSRAWCAHVCMQRICSPVSREAGQSTLVQAMTNSAAHLSSDKDQRQKLVFIGVGYTLCYVRSWRTSEINDALRGPTRAPQTAVVQLERAPADCVVPPVPIVPPVACHVKLDCLWARYSLSAEGWARPATAMASNAVR